MRKINLKSRPDPKKLAKVAAYYKYNPDAPAYFSDIPRWNEWLQKTNERNSDTKTAAYVGKIIFIRRLLRERWAELRSELAFIEWVKSGAPRTHSIPRYDTSLIKDPMTKKLYTDSLLRSMKVSDEFERKDKYNKLLIKHAKEEPAIPPSMSGNDDWRVYFMNCNSMDRLNQIDSDLVTILNTHEVWVKNYNAKRKVALDYLIARRKRPSKSIGIMGEHPEKPTVYRTQQAESGETSSV